MRTNHLSHVLPLASTSVLALLALLVAIDARSVWLQWLGDVLTLRQQPVPADAVVVLAGSPQTRPSKGVELVRTGYAPTLYLLEDVVCPPLTRRCAHLSELRRRGERTPLDSVLPGESVVLLLPELPDGASGTAEEAALAWARLRALGAKRILLVTDEYHSRRATLVWRHVVAGEAAVVSVPSVDERAPIVGWWRHRGGTKAVFTEYGKFLVYGLLRLI